MLGAPATGIAPFDSIGMTYLLHCLPGEHRRARRKPSTRCGRCLADDGVVFGATILSGGVQTTGAARALMRVYNRKGVFSNAADTLPDLRAALDQRFRSVEITVVGCVALFVAREPR
ncbi:hypothetical protein ACU4GR_16535 [Methylobacterium oryzae CBMB20]